MTDDEKKVPDDLGWMRDVLEAATPGPWNIEREYEADDEEGLPFPHAIGPIENWEHASLVVERVEADAAAISLMLSLKVEVLDLIEAADGELTCHEHAETLKWCNKCRVAEESTERLFSAQHRFKAALKAARVRALEALMPDTSAEDARQALRRNIEEID